MNFSVFRAHQNSPYKLNLHRGSNQIILWFVVLAFQKDAIRQGSYNILRPY